MRKDPGMPDIHLKRIYQPAGDQDGLRVLVDRLWARGISKADAHLGAWMKELGPSDELRTWFGHRAERWSGFQERYRRELSAPIRQLFLALLQSATGTPPITILYGARDTVQNEAVVLRQYLIDQGPSAGLTQDDTLILLAAVEAVVAAQPSGEAPTSRLVPFVHGLSSRRLEDLLQMLQDRGELRMGEGGWQLTARGRRLVHAVPAAPTG